MKDFEQKKNMVTFKNISEEKWLRFFFAFEHIFHVSTKSSQYFQLQNLFFFTLINRIRGYKLF